MKNVQKYEKGYFLPPENCTKWVNKDAIDKAPIWCSVDLRDGNQALINPMDLQQKLDFFQFLTKVGFKQIEVSFPAASETDFNFVRKLIEENLIPDDVTIQVLTQAREHIIKRTFEAIRGAKSAIVHFYNSVSKAQREQVFKMSKEQIKEIAVSGAKLVKQCAEETEGNFCFEYSPESFSGTEPEFSLEVCNAVLEVLQPTPEKKVIINLPSTVQMSMPHVYASQIEYMCEHLFSRENVIVSVHPHNDRGTGVSDAELALLAGADRVEGTLFGNGERTGNADIVTIALNMFSHGVDPKLNFENIPSVAEVYERCTGMRIAERHPYSGDLVFTAFSGSHQDAIAKGMKVRQDLNKTVWDVPYLPIDPKDVGRDYDGDVIRINSQSGKGGIGYILEHKYGFDLPPKMREHFGYVVKNISDREHKEMLFTDIYKAFESTYVNLQQPLAFIDCNFTHNGSVKAKLKFSENGKPVTLIEEGNGGLDAVSNALKKQYNLEFSDLIYKEHALTQSSGSVAAAYVGFKGKNGKTVFGTGTDRDIMTASIKALFSAVNNELKI